MKAQELAAAIIDDARKEAQRLAGEGNERAARIRKETDRLLRKRRRELYRKAKEAEEQERKRLEARERRDAQLKILACKQEIIDGLFEDAAERLGKEREKLLRHLWTRANEQMDVTSVIAAKKDRAFFSRRTTVDGTIESIGGFIAIGERARIDCRFETLLETVRERNVHEIAEVLFGG